MGGRHDDNKGSNDEQDGLGEDTVVPSPRSYQGIVYAELHTHINLVIHHPGVPEIAIRCLSIILTIIHVEWPLRCLQRFAQLAEEEMNNLLSGLQPRVNIQAS